MAKSSKASSDNKRRHERLSSHRSATLLSAGQPPTSVEIRDFCPMGLYLSYGEDASPRTESRPGAHPVAAAASPKLGSLVEVSFKGSKQGTAAPFRIRGRIVHAEPLGLGLLVEKMPPQAYASLQEDSLRAAPAPHGRINPDSDQGLRQACRNRLQTFLLALEEDFHARAERDLIKAQAEAYFMDSSRFQLGIQTLGSQRVQLQTSYRGLVTQCLDALETGTPLPAFQDKPQEEELSLVEEDAFEDWLAQSSVIHQLELAYKPALANLQGALGQLLNTAVERENNPFGPEVLCRAFGYVLRQLNLPRNLREQVYKSLGTSLAALLAPLYEELNVLLKPVADRLTQNAIIKSPLPPTAPQASPAQATATATVHPDAPQDTGSGQAAARERALTELNELLEGLLGPYKAGNTGASMPSGGARDAMAYNLGSILTQLNQMAGPARGKKGAGNWSHPLLAPMDPRKGDSSMALEDNHNLVRVLNHLSEAFQTLDQAPPESGTPIGTARRTVPKIRQDAALQHLLATLDTLPPRTPAEKGAPSVSLAERLHAHALQILDGPVPEAARTTLDSMTRLLDMAGGELPSHSQLEPLISAIERPLLKLALTDPSFLGDMGHPAKQVVDLLDQYSIATDDQGRFFDPKLHQFLSLLVERLLARASQEPGVFGLARDYLARMLGPIRQSRRRRVALMQETCEAKERIKSARLRTHDALENHLGGKSIPVVLNRFLDQGWRQYMVLLELRKGLNHPDWQRAMTAVKMLWDWLQPVNRNNPPTGQAVAEMMAFLEEKIASVNTEPDNVVQLLDELTAPLLRRDDTDRDQLATVTMPAQKPSAGRSAASASPELLDWAGRLVIGDWWLITQGSLKVPMQLIWLSEPQGQCAFVNRSATQKLELSLAELKQRLDGGTALTTSNRDQSLFERSGYAVIDDMYQRLNHEASHDPVTNLLNRKGFMRVLLGEGMQQDGQSHYIGILEFDQFRVIYNNCGSEAGETLSRTLSSEITAELDRDDIVAALRDDTFAVLLPKRNRIQVLDIAGKLLKRLKDYRFVHERERYSIGVSIGIAEYQPTTTAPEEAMRNADAACLMAKSAGRNRIQRYEPSSEQLRAQQSLMSWAGRIDQIVQDEGLYLRCQKVEPLDRSLLPYYEILLGIRDQDGEIGPKGFLPAVERWNRSHEIDMWVVERTFEWIDANPASFEQTGGFAINLASSSLNNPEVLAYLHGKLGRAGFSVDKITFELTETSTIDNYQAAREFIRQIRRYGCHFSVDDLGSGYSSFAHLKNLRTDSIKIDGIFVQECDRNSTDLAMVKSMNDIGHALGLKTVAEFVETPEVLARMREIGVDYVQGFALHKPVPLCQLSLEPCLPAMPITQPPEAFSDSLPPASEPAESGSELPDEPATTLPDADTEGVASPRPSRRYAWHNPNSSRFGQS